MEASGGWNRCGCGCERCDVWAYGGYAARGWATPARCSRSSSTSMRREGESGTVEVLPRLDRGAHVVVDQPVPTPGARLRAAARALRGHSAVGNDRPDDPPL